MSNEPSVLESSLQAAGWPSENAAMLSRSAHAVTYESGATIFHAGESADLMYVLLKGAAKLYYSSQSGDRLLVAIPHRGDVLAFPQIEELDFAWNDQAGQVFSAEASSPCDVAIISKAQIQRALHSLPPVDVLRIMGHMIQRWSLLACRVLSFLTMDVRSRLAQAISEIADDFGIPDGRGRLIRLKLSHEDFGEIVGASRPMVSKHLKDFATAGIFYKDKGRYILSTPPAKPHHRGECANVA